jgi:hypothetical protein
MRHFVMAAVGAVTLGVTGAALPLTAALASTNVQYTDSAPVLSMNPTKDRPALSDHLGGQVRVRNHYDQGSLNNQLLTIMMNEHH